MLSTRAHRVGTKELEIFDHFQIDKNLPKYQNTSNPTKNNEGALFNVSEGEILMNPSSGLSMDGSFEKISLLEKIKNWIIRKLQGTKIQKQKKPTISILDFFINLSKSFEELTPIAGIAEHYEKAVKQAMIMGQTTLIEKLSDMIDVVRGESHLIAMKLKKYVTEKQIIDFYEKVGEDKNLKLTWIKNFGRIIPEDIYKIKKDVDERKIFDNYVILHYDPENNGDEMTKEEIEYKKDPILFGLIKNSKKLYYIADWKDDYCELTLEEMFNTLGSKTLQINNRSVKSFIDKI